MNFNISEIKESIRFGTILTENYEEFKDTNKLIQSIEEHITLYNLSNKKNISI